MPLVSVILCVYNGEKYLREAIDSVLNQSYPHIELLAVDDGSTDRTSEILREYGSKIRSFFQTNRGQPAAQNFALGQVKGKYLSFLDADDLYLQDKIRSHVQFLEEHPEISMVFGSVQQFYSPELSVDEAKQWVIPTGPISGYLAAAGLFRKECFDQLLFNENQKIGNFVDWYMRAMEAGMRHQLLPALVYRRRIHGKNMGIQAVDPRTQYLEIVKAALKRRELISF